MCVCVHALVFLHIGFEKVGVDFPQNNCPANQHFNLFQFYSHILFKTLNNLFLYRMSSLLTLPGTYTSCEDGS